MPFYEPGMQIDPHHGRHDKIEITLSGTVVNVDEEDFATSRVFETAVDPGWPRLLQQPKGFLGGNSILQPVADGWLFKGKTRFIKTVNPQQRKAAFSLSVNPTRFAAHVRRFGRESVAALADVPVHELLRVAPEMEAELEAGSADGNDNWIPAAHRWFTVVNEQWSELVALYVDAIAQLLVLDFNIRAATAPTDLPLRLILPSPTQRVPAFLRCEVHWEFAVDDARLAYLPIERAIRAAAPTFAATEIPNNEDERDPAIRDGRDLAARWISTEIRKGVSLKVYAKTGNRLRFEITYRPPKRKTMGDLVLPEFGFTDSTSFLDRLELLQHDGARRLNTALSGVGVFDGLAASRAVFDLATILAQISRLAEGDRSVIQNVLSQLVSDGGISAIPNSPAWNVADPLTKQGVLQRVSLAQRGRAVQYLLHPQARAIFSRFAAWT